MVWDGSNLTGHLFTILQARQTGTYKQTPNAHDEKFPQNGQETYVNTNVKYKTIELLEDNLGKIIDNLQFENDFLDNTQKA